MAKTVIEKLAGIRKVKNYPPWEFEKRWAIGFAVGMLTHWFIFGAK